MTISRVFYLSCLLLLVHRSASVHTLRAPQNSLAPLAEDPSYWGRVLGFGSFSMSVSMSLPTGPPSGGGNSCPDESGCDVCGDGTIMNGDKIVTIDIPKLSNKTGDIGTASCDEFFVLGCAFIDESMCPSFQDHLQEECCTDDGTVPTSAPTPVDTNGCRDPNSCDICGGGNIIDDSLIVTIPNMKTGEMETASCAEWFLFGCLLVDQENCAEVQSYLDGCCEEGPSPVEPTPVPIEPTPAPFDPIEPTPAPIAPSPAPFGPGSPTSAPIEQTPAPIEPSPAPFDPIDPTPSPVEPTLEPLDPTLLPISPTPSPIDPTPSPMDPTPAPMEPPTPSPVSPTPSPFSPSPSCEDEYDAWEACIDREDTCSSCLLEPEGGLDDDFFRPGCDDRFLSWHSMVDGCCDTCQGDLDAFKTCKQCANPTPAPISTPSPVREPFCGDGEVDEGEECEPGDECPGGELCLDFCQCPSTFALPPLSEACVCSICPTGSVKDDDKVVTIVSPLNEKLRTDTCGNWFDSICIFDGGFCNTYVDVLSSCCSDSPKGRRNLRRSNSVL